MTLASSPYQTMKLELAQYLPVDRDFLHFGIGVVLTIVAIFATRKARPLRPLLIAFLLACLFGAGMESLDRSDDIRTFGFWRWKESAKDFLLTVLIPAISLLIAAFFKRTPTRRA